MRRPASQWRAAVAVAGNDNREVVERLDILTDQIRRMKGDTFQFAVSSMSSGDYQTVTEQKIFPAIVNQLRRARGLTEIKDVLGL